jgi:hypothetical protein
VALSLTHAITLFLLSGHIRLPVIDFNCLRRIIVYFISDALHYEYVHLLNETPDAAVQRSAFLLPVREVLDSNFDLETRFPGFSQSLQANIGIEKQLGLSHYFPPSYQLIINCHPVIRRNNQSYWQCYYKKP